MQLDVEESTPASDMTSELQLEIASMLQSNLILSKI